MDREAVYQKQKFGQKIGFGRAPALLVVDFVNGFADPEMFGGGNIRDAIAATMPLLDFGRSKGMPIAFTRIVYADDGSDAGIWCRKAPRVGKGAATNRRNAMTWILIIIVGGILGWLASIVMRTDAQQGILLNIVVGIIGAILGGLLLAPLLGGGSITSGDFSLPNLLISLLGAIILLAIVNLVRRGSVR